MKSEDQILLDAIAQTIFDKKGSNILALDLRSISTITDFVIIAEGNVDKHVIAIGSAIEQMLKARGIRPSHIEGMGLGDWVVLDYLTMMIHLFEPGLREMYRLEELWTKGEIVDLHIETDRYAIGLLRNDQQ